MRKIVCALVLVVSAVAFVACEEEKIQVEEIELLDPEYTESDGDEDSNPIKTS